MLTDKQTFALFTLLVSEEVENLNICFGLLYLIEQHYEKSKKNWSVEEGLISIATKMKTYIHDNRAVFIINPLSKPY